MKSIDTRDDNILEKIDDNIFEKELIDANIDANILNKKIYLK